MTEDTCSVNIFDPEKVEKVKSVLSDDEDTLKLAVFFKTISDQTRLKIIQSLIIEELCVCDLAEITNVSISAVSHQLRILRDKNIVKYRKQGKMAYYSIVDEHIDQIINLVKEHISE
ncbi:MAG: winged helix-turn-helix transcriptional regulator [Chlorobi bacterium]|nr:winged helix-turn-helix transcriptional regulator [Chlorobiota bacterium]